MEREMIPLSGSSLPFRQISNSFQFSPPGQIAGQAVDRFLRKAQVKAGEKGCAHFDPTHWPPRSLSGFSRNIDVEDQTVMIMEMEKGIMGAYLQCHFAPDACLVNRYEPGARLSLHQDRDEQDFSAPIVSVSLGLPAVFLLGTPSRKDRPQRHRLQHGDVVVWGGPSRLAFHGVAPLADGEHTLLGRRRINLTFRRAG